jgi:hypothetical protein
MSPTSISGSSPTVTENRTFKVLSVLAGGDREQWLSILTLDSAVSLCICDKSYKLYAEDRIEKVARWATSRSV